MWCDDVRNFGNALFATILHAFVTFASFDPYLVYLQFFILGFLTNGTYGTREVHGLDLVHFGSMARELHALTLQSQQ